MQQLTLGKFQLFANLSDEKYDALKADIAKHGVLVPIEVDQHGEILDGHHRVRAWTEIRADGARVHDYPRLIRHFDNDDDREEHAAKLNSARRDISREDKIRNAIRWREHGWSYRRIGDALAVAEGTVRYWIPQATAQNYAVEFPKRSIGKDGRSRPARMPRPAVLAANDREQERAGSFLTTIDGEVVDGYSGEILISVDVRRALNAQKREDRNQGLVFASNAPMPDKRYAVIYADPPWRYDFSETNNRKIENQYPTMTEDEIAALDVPAADDAVLFMWATNPKLREAFTVLDGWGFDYVTNMVWVKDRIGMGYYARSRHELLLIAKRGSLPVPLPDNRPDSVIEGKRTEHSAKPLHLYDVIERMYPGFAKIELFCRSPYEGWDAWGNELTV